MAGRHVRRQAAVWLGLTMGCAQCHDHPFDKWKRDEFWSYAAFFAGNQHRSTSGSFRIGKYSVFFYDQ